MGLSKWHRTLLSTFRRLYVPRGLVRREKKTGGARRLIPLSDDALKLQWKVTCSKADEAHYFFFMQNACAAPVHDLSWMTSLRKTFKIAAWQGCRVIREKEQHNTMNRDKNFSKFLLRVYITKRSAICLGNGWYRAPPSQGILACLDSS